MSNKLTVIFWPGMAAKVVAIDCVRIAVGSRNNNVVNTRKRKDIIIIFIPKQIWCKCGDKRSNVNSTVRILSTSDYVLRARKCMRKGEKARLTSHFNVFYFLTKNVRDKRKINLFTMAQTDESEAGNSIITLPRVVCSNQQDYW